MVETAATADRRACFGNSQTWSALFDPSFRAANVFAGSGESTLEMRGIEKAQRAVPSAETPM